MNISELEGATITRVPGFSQLRYETKAGIFALMRWLDCEADIVYKIVPTFSGFPPPIHVYPVRTLRDEYAVLVCNVSLSLLQAQEIADWILSKGQL